MSVCKRCGATFNCGMADGVSTEPCWCTRLPALPATALPLATDLPLSADFPLPAELPLSTPAVPRSSAYLSVPAEGNPSSPDADAVCLCPACLRREIEGRADEA
jgi:hypothetical protein